MKSEDQVVSLELSKRLKELGVKQESYFFWVNPELTVDNVTQLLNENERFIDHHPDLYFSAFTVAELGELLPVNINDHYFTSHRCAREGWWVMYSTGVIEHNKHEYWAKSEADARAKLLLGLIEQGIYKP